jgi:hypothetical protein
MAAHNDDEPESQASEELVGDTLMPAIPDDLDALAAAIRSEYAAAGQERDRAYSHARRALEHAIRVGRLLRAAQAKVPSGTWLQWLEKNTGIPRTTAADWMRLADNERHVVHVDSEREALRLLARPRVATVQMTTQPQPTAPAPVPAQIKTVQAGGNVVVPVQEATVRPGADVVLHSGAADAAPSALAAEAAADTGPPSPSQESGPATERAPLGEEEQLQKNLDDYLDEMCHLRIDLLKREILCDGMRSLAPCWPTSARPTSSGTGSRASCSCSS